MELKRWIIMSVIHFSTMFSAVFLLIFRIEYQPLTSRNKYVLIFGFFLNNLYGVAILVFNNERVLKMDSCGINYLSRSSINMMIHLLYLYRVVYIWYNHQKQKSGFSLSKAKTQVYPVFNARNYSFLYIFNVSILMIYPFTFVTIWKRDINYYAKTVCKMTPYYDYVVVSLITLAYFIVCLLIRNSKDNFFYRLEFQFTACSFFILGIPFAVVNRYHLSDISAFINIFLNCSTTFSSHILISLLTFRKERPVATFDLESGFTKMMNDEYTLEKFHEFLKQEFSFENYLFYKEASDFRKNFLGLSQDECKAVEIYERFIKYNAIFELNLPFWVSRDLNVDIKKKKFHADMFENALENVTNLMKYDSYLRFETYKKQQMN